MTEKDLSRLLKGLDTDIPVNKWKSDKEAAGKKTRIVYWPFYDTDVAASGDTFEEVRTYQISIYATQPDDPVIKKLRNALRNQGIHPKIQHEYVIEEGMFHSFTSVDVIQDE